MAQQLNDLDVWDGTQVPIVIVNNDNEFEIWDDNVPVEERVGGSQVSTRRRAFEF